MRGGIVALAALFCSSASIAEPDLSTVYVVTAVDREAITAIEIMSMKTIGDLRRVWSFTNFAPQSKIKIGESPITEIRALLEIECAQGTSKPLQSVFYNKNAVVLSVQNNTPATYNTPDTNGAQIQRWACGKGDINRVAAFEKRVEMLSFYNRFLARNDSKGK